MRRALLAPRHARGMCCSSDACAGCGGRATMQQAARRLAECLKRGASGSLKISLWSGTADIGERAREAVLAIGTCSYQRSFNSAGCLHGDRRRQRWRRAIRNDRLRRGVG